MVFCIWIIVIACLVLQRCSPAKLTVPLYMEALGNVWYGLWRPLTNLMQTFQACQLCTFNVAAIFFSFFFLFFFQGHPYIWRTTVRHDKAYPIFLHGDHINDYFTRWPCKLTWSPYAILSFVTNGVPYDRPYTENFKLNEHTHKGTQYSSNLYTC